MAITKITALAAAFKERVASRNNPSGLKASDVSAQGKTETDAEMLTYIPLDRLDIDQVGDQTYFPLAISGTADGGVALQSLRTYAAVEEANGDIAILRSATNSMIDGVYYAIAKADVDGKVVSAAATSTRYDPGLSGGYVPYTVWNHNDGVLMGMAVIDGTYTYKPFIALTSGTMDQSKHVACLCGGDMAEQTNVAAKMTCIRYGGKIWAIMDGMSGNAVQFAVYTCSEGDIEKGATVNFTRVKGWNCTGLSSVVKNNADCIWSTDNIVTNDLPPDRTGSLAYRAGLRIMVGLKGNMLRILCGYAWYTNNKVNYSRSGITQWHIDVNLDTKASVVPAKYQNCLWQQVSEGGFGMVGSISKDAKLAGYNDGYWFIGSGNNQGSWAMTNNGNVLCTYADNLSIPVFFKVRIDNYAGTVFDQFAVDWPSATGMGDRQQIKDRIIGAIGASSHIGILSKTRILVTTNLANGTRIINIDNDWDTTYHYKNRVVDVTGFPPPARYADMGTQYNVGMLTVVHMNESTSVIGTWLNQYQAATKTKRDPVTLLPVGDDISIDPLVLKDFETKALAAYNGDGKPMNLTWAISAISVPPEETGAPVVFCAHYFDKSNLSGLMLAYEVTVSARKGKITITGLGALIASTARVGDIVNSQLDNGYMPPLSYFKSGNEWLMCGVPPIYQNTSGDGNMFSVRGCKLTSGAWQYGVIDWVHTYFANSGTNYQCHPVWGFGWVNLVQSDQLGKGGHIFNVVGTTVTEWGGWTPKATYMVATMVAASGWDVYVNEPIAVLMNGASAPLVESHYNLKDFSSNAPQTKTFQTYVVAGKGSSKLEFSIDKPADTATRVNIGTITTGGTQISTINLNKVTKLGTKTL